MNEVPTMFNRIAPRYDLVNRVLSFWMDVGWRTRLARMVIETKPSRVLDVATGTGDVAIEIVRTERGQKLTMGTMAVEVVGIDPSEGMLEIGKRKVAEAGLQDRITLQVASAESLPFPDASFDAVTISFGIRNAADRAQAFREMHRVLKPGGHIFILEFSTPPSALIRPFWRLHLRLFVPLVGAFLTGDRAAYTYLNKTIEAFPSGKAFLDELAATGFTNGSQTRLLFGAVSIYSAKA